MNNYIWYVLRTAPRQEKLAAKLLKRKGFRAFCPCHKVSTTPRSRRKFKYQPVAAGYILIGFICARPNWYDALSLRSVIGVIGAQGRPTPLQAGEVKRMLNFRNHKPHQRKKFNVGDKVQVVAGAFKDYDATIFEVKKGRARVKLGEALCVLKLEDLEIVL